MQAILLAAGRGSRMKRLTDESPKCLAPLMGRPLLEWSLSSLRQAGCQDITLIRGYQKEKLQGDFNTIDNPHWSSSNMVVTLACASAILQQQDSILSYSDIVYHSDHVKALMQCPGDICMTYDKEWLSLWKLRFEDPLSDAETFIQENQTLKEIGGKTSNYQDVQGQYMGLLKCTPKGWSLIQEHLDSLDAAVLAKLDMTSLLRALLQKGITIYTVPVEGKWIEADLESDLEAYEAVLQNKKLGEWSHDWRTSQV